MRIIQALIIFVSISNMPAFSQETNQVPGLAVKLAPIKSLAILPIDPCPGALNCEEIENKLSSAIYELKLKSSWKPVVFSSRKVKQQLFNSGLKTAPTGNEELVKLAADLGVDGFLIPKVPYLGSQRKERTLLTAEDEATEARVELEIFLVSDPHIVFRGKDQGQDTTWSTPANYVEGLLKKLLVKVFPKG